VQGAHQARNPPAVKLQAKETTICWAPPQSRSSMSSNTRDRAMAAGAWGLAGWALI